LATKGDFQGFFSVTEITISLPRLVPAFTIVSRSSKVLWNYHWE